MLQCQAIHPGFRLPRSFAWGTNRSLSNKGLLSALSRFTRDLFPVRQSFVRHGSSLAGGSGWALCGGSVGGLCEIARPLLLDLFTAVSAALSAFRNFSRSSISRLQVQLAQGFSASEFSSKFSSLESWRTRFLAHRHDRQGSSLSFSMESPVVITTAKNRPSRTYDHVPILSEKKKKKKKINISYWPAVTTILNIISL